MAKFVFSSKEDEILLYNVQQNKVLFDSSELKYKDTILKDVIWKDIAQKVGRTVEDCKKRWRNIRDTYLKLKKKLTTRTASLRKRKWALMDYLSFLGTVECESNTSTSVESFHELTTSANNSICEDSTTLYPEVELVTENQDVQIPAMSSFGGKRIKSKEDKISVTTLAKKSKKRNELLSNNQESSNLLALQLNKEEDAIDVFFRSIAMTVKKLPLWAINEAKLQTLTMVNELEKKIYDP